MAVLNCHGQQKSTAKSSSEEERQGMNALASHLADVAAARFKSALDQPNLSAADVQRLTLLLAESHVRSNQAQEALKVLENPEMHHLPAAMFWQAQAFSSLGRFQEAAHLFTRLLATQNPPYFAESVLTRSRLLSALGNHRDAIAGLNLLTLTKSPHASRAKIDQTTLLLHTGKIAEARKALPDLKSLKGRALREARILHAKILQAETLYQKAADAFTEIIATNQKEGTQLPEILHPAAIGLARARASLNQRPEATDALLSFIQNQPDSPLLAEAFSLLEFLVSGRENGQDPVNTLISERLEQWSVDTQGKHPAIFPESSSGAADYMPFLPSFDHPQLHAHALMLRAIALSGATEPEARELQRHLITRLRWEHPDSPLALDGMLLYARSLYRQKQNDKAQNILENILSQQSSGSAQIEALLVLAADFFQQKNFQQAAHHFDKATQLLSSTAQTSAVFDLGLSQLLNSDEEGFQMSLSKAAPDLKTSLQLEQALYMASTSPAAALPVLDRFILDNPTHYRVADAQLAVAYCAMQQQPPALSLARAQLDTLQGSKQFPEKTLVARIQFALASNDQPGAVNLCRQFLENFPSSADANKVTLLLGGALYQNGDLSDARITLQKLAQTDPGMAAPALMIAARAAARTGTPQALTDAITLFDNVIQSATSLAPFAVLEKARTMIDAKSPAHLVIAIKELTDIFDKLPPESELRIPTGIMLMEALYALGGSEPIRYNSALAVQQKLLDSPGISREERHLISYFRGLTLEQLNKADEALSVYYEVIDSHLLKAPNNWDYFERCGFNAISLLEKNARWESAIGLAKKLSAFPSPRAKEAAERARRLSLEHMVWED
jgi:tetratricopeptide (TPR) repeat protein